MVDGVLGEAADASQPSIDALGNSLYPRRTHGKVFMTIPGTGDFVCSGNVVRSHSHTLVWTAGHCVFDRDFCARGASTPTSSSSPATGRQSAVRDLDRDASC